MSWKVTSRDSLDLSQYTFLPFGRFNLAMPFLSDFLNSGEVVSDLVEFNVSNAGALQRAIVKLSGVKLEMRTTKRDGTVLEKPIAVLDSAAVKKATTKLGIELEVIASENADGKLVRQYVALKKVAA